MNAFTTTPRRSLTDQQSAALFLERGGKCGICGRKVRSGERWDWDHILALSNGGQNDRDNLQIACGICHASKTKADAKTAAKTRSVATRGIVPEAHRKKSRLSKRANVRYDWQAGRYFWIDKAEEPPND